MVKKKETFALIPFNSFEELYGFLIKNMIQNVTYDSKKNKRTH